MSNCPQFARNGSVQNLRMSVFSLSSKENKTLFFFFFRKTGMIMGGKSSELSLELHLYKTTIPLVSNQALCVLKLFHMRQYDACSFVCLFVCFVIQCPQRTTSFLALLADVFRKWSSRRLKHCRTVDTQTNNDSSCRQGSMVEGFCISVSFSIVPIATKKSLRHIYYF